jgi:hypothetical protein
VESERSVDAGGVPAGASAANPARLQGSSRTKAMVAARAFNNRYRISTPVAEIRPSGGGKRERKVIAT